MGKGTGPSRHKRRSAMPHSLDKRCGRRDALQQNVRRPPLSDNTCGGRRSAPVYTAAAAIPKLRGGRRATTPRAIAVAHRQVWRPPRRTTCGGGREVTTREAAAAQQQQVWRPPSRSTTTRAAAAAERQHVQRSPRRVLERHAQRRCKPCCCKKQNIRNQVLTGFEPPTPGCDPKVTPNESGCLTSH